MGVCQSKDQQDQHAQSEDFGSGRAEEGGKAKQTSSHAKRKEIALAPESVQTVYKLTESEHSQECKNGERALSRKKFSKGNAGRP